jgi:hypothetical protein
LGVDSWNFLHPGNIPTALLLDDGSEFPCHMVILARGKRRQG